jgi:hypothetical protein
MGVRNSCDGKVKHKSRLSAELYIEHSSSGSQQNIYKCKYCKTFHIGNKKRTDKKWKLQSKKSYGDDLFKDKSIKIRKMKL